MYIYLHVHLQGKVISSNICSCGGPITAEVDVDFQTTGAVKF